jgi:small multidrug resistance pump
MMPKISVLFGWLLVIWAALSNAGGSVAMKYFHRANGDTTLADIGINWNLRYLALALLCYISSFVAYVFVLKFVPVSVAYPLITGLSILMILSITSVFLGEDLSGTMVAGSVLIVMGVFLIGGPSK